MVDKLKYMLALKDKLDSEGFKGYDLDTVCEPDQKYFDGRAFHDLFVEEFAELHHIKS
jgi:hypothetical protein